MRLSKKLCFIILAALLALCSAAPVFALTSGSSTINAVTSTEIVAVSVNTATINYGVVTSSSTSSPQSVTVTNSGNVTESFEVSGDSAYCEDEWGDVINTWTLAGTIGPDAYKHEWSLTSVGGYSALTTSYAQFATGKAAGAAQALWLKLTAPSSTSSLGVYVAPVYVRATAP